MTRGKTTLDDHVGAELETSRVYPEMTGCGGWEKQAQSGALDTANQQPAA